MAIKTFRSIGNAVSLVLENGTMLFSKSLDKQITQDLFQVASGVKEMSDDEIIALINGNNVDNLTPKEKVVIEEKVFTKGISEGAEKYADLFEQRGASFYRKDIELSIPKFVFSRYMGILETFGQNSNEFKAIDNFWMWSSLNPNKHAREEILEFLKTGGFMITPNGYFVAYRGVKTKKENNKVLTEFISDQFVKTKAWKKSPANYLITTVGDNQYKLEKRTDQAPLGTPIGNLKELYDNLANLEYSTVYTDKHTGKMTIKLGQEVRIPRTECDESSANACSRGLHLGNKQFGMSSFGDTIIVCLCNPMNVVAVPGYNQNKLRTCAYFPMGVAQRNPAGELIELDYSQFDDVYFNEQVNTLKELAKANKPEEANVQVISFAKKNLTNLSSTVKGRIVKI